MQFTKDMKLPDAIPEKGIQKAVELMKTGKLYRYNFKSTFDKNSGYEAAQNEPASEVAKLEYELAEYLGYKYVVAVNSCGSALFLSLKAAGVKAQDKVFTNAFTFTAVPSSIVHACATPVYVECGSDYTLDAQDLRNKIAANPDVRFLVLSHMRGHIADMDTIKEICTESNIYLIEDCAHSLGTKWQDKESGEQIHVGHHSEIACYSAQSYKLLNAGEGGFVATNDEHICAYAILAAGSYEKLYKKHLSRPLDDSFFESIKQDVPNFSLRMSNLAAAALRPQIETIETRVDGYRERYQQLTRSLSAVVNVEIPDSSDQVRRVCDSIQFKLKNMTVAQLEECISQWSERGVNLQVFGNHDNARYFKNWAYSFEEQPELKQTDELISFTCDMRISLSFTQDDISLLGYIIKDVLYSVLRDRTQEDYKNGLTDHFGDSEEIVSHYDSWSLDYDKEHYRNGWTTLLNKVAYTLRSYLQQDSQILDIGCGTGLLAQELYSYGCQGIHGMDISRQSLEVAAELGIYQDLHYGVLGNHLDLESDSYNALVSTGVFTRNQVPLNSFEELFRVLKPQGLVAIVVRVEDDGFYYNELLRYCQEGSLEELSKLPIKVLSSCSHELVIFRYLGEAS